MKKLKDDDIIYIAPVISGGGGKKGMIFAAVAFVVGKPFDVTSRDGLLAQTRKFKEYGLEIH